MPFPPIVNVPERVFESGDALEAAATEHQRLAHELDIQADIHRAVGVIQEDCANQLSLGGAVPGKEYWSRVCCTWVEQTCELQEGLKPFTEDGQIPAITSIAMERHGCASSRSRVIFVICYSLPYDFCPA